MTFLLIGKNSKLMGNGSWLGNDAEFLKSRASVPWCLRGGYTCALEPGCFF